MDDTDQILSEAEASTNNEIPMSGDVPEQVEAQPPQPQEYEFTHSGQQVKAPIEKILKWAAMGYGAPNRIGELNKKISDYENRFKTYESYDKIYKPVDEWAKSNPDKWQSLLSTWQQAQQTGGAHAQLPPEILDKLQAHDQFIQQTQAEQIQQRERQADTSLDGEITSIRKQYPHLDLDAPDESGNSLEFQVLEHATRNGIPSFRAAFRDYCFDRLNTFSETKGREQAQVSPKTRAALLGKDPAATRGRSTPDLKTRNYDQIHELVLEELGLA